MTLQGFMLFALLLFCIGLYGVLARRNLIGMLIGIELMLNAASVNFLAANYFLSPDPVLGQVIVLFIIGLAAAEAGIALAIIMAVYRQRAAIDVDMIAELKG